MKFQVYFQNPVVSKPLDSEKVNLDLKQLGITGKCKVRDLWAKNDLGVYSDVVTLDVKNHGARLVRISKVK